MNRMSEVFELPVKRHYEIIVGKNEERYVYKEHIDSAVIAINNHDRLTDENARLREENESSHNKLNPRIQKILDSKE